MAAQRCVSIASHVQQRPELGIPTVLCFTGALPTDSFLQFAEICQTIFTQPEFAAHAASLGQQTAQQYSIVAAVLPTFQAATVVLQLPPEWQTEGKEWQTVMRIAALLLASPSLAPAISERLRSQYGGTALCAQPPRLPAAPAQAHQQKQEWPLHTL